jgi:ankyrin repeat protein
MSTDTRILPQLREAIDKGNMADIDTIFQEHPDLDWNAITPNGLSALWWALVPPKNKSINCTLIMHLLSLKLEDGRLVINPSQLYCGLRPDDYVMEYFEPNESYREITNKIQEAQKLSLLPAVKHIKGNPDILDFTMKQSVITGLTFEGGDLSKQDLRGWDLRGVNLRGANLTSADLRLIMAAGAQWEQCNLTNALFNQWLFPEALLGSIHCTSELLKEKSFTFNSNNSTLLHKAVKKNDFEIVKAIFASKHCTLKVLAAQDSLGKTALHLAIEGIQTIEGIENDNLEIAKAILASEHCKSQLLEAQDSLGKTALHWAIENDNLEIAKAILASEHCKSQLLEAQDILENTALHLAIKSNNFEIVKAILASNACTSQLLKAQDYPQETALHLAIKSNNFEIVKDILASEHCTSQLLEAHPAVSKKTALHLAIEKDNLKIVKAILASEHCKSQLLEAQGSFRKTALHWAIEKNNLEIIHAILDSKHCTSQLLEAQDSYGKTALHWAIEKNNVEIIQAILASKHCTLKVLERQNHDRKTALHWAIEKDNLKIVKAILASEHCTSQLLEAQNGDGKTALHLATEKNNVEIVQAILASNACTSEFLKEKGKDFFIQTLLPALLKKTNADCISRSKILDLFKQIKDLNGKYAFIHKQKNPIWDTVRLFFKSNHKLQDNPNFWHTATYQQAVKLLKEAYIIATDDIKEDRQESEKFIDYVRGNAPLHRHFTTTRKRLPH